jgi:hypothetical protein
LRIDRGNVAEIGAAVLFGLSTPLARMLVGEMPTLQCRTGAADRALRTVLSVGFRALRPFGLLWPYEDRRRPMKSRTRRSVAVLAIALTLPFSGMASYASANPCTSGETTNAAATQGKDCCKERQAPCDTPTKGCPASSCNCAHGTGQAQALEQAHSSFLTTATTRIRVTSLVATVLTATSPDGQWRPPRSP